jgi:HEAT repeat protein
VLATLDEPTWNAVRKLLGPEEIRYRVQRARHLPILSDETPQLAALLSHADPDVRVRAIRSLDRVLLQKLIACLDDPYTEWAGFPDQYAVAPVSEEAREMIAWQGPSLILLLLELVGQPRNAQQRRSYQQEVCEVLGKIGPDPVAQKFLQKTLDAEDYDDRWFALQALAEWGPAGVPLLADVADKQSEHVVLRRVATEALAQNGTAATAGPVLRKLLKPGVADELVGAACEGASRLRLADAVPDLKRIALDEKIDQNARYRAINALAHLASKKDAEATLLALFDARTHYPVRAHAMSSAAGMRLLSAVPKLLDALEDERYDIRAAADRGLRTLADLPNGVGMDLQQRNSEAWRRWWAERGKR